MKKKILLVPLFSLTAIAGSVALSVSLNKDPSSHIVTNAISVDNTDLAQGKTVTANNQETANPAANAVDLNPFSRWSTLEGRADGNSPKFPNGHNLVVDLGAAHSVKAFEVQFEKTNIKKFKIETSADRNTWNLVHQVTGNDTELYFPINLETAQTGVRYVRLTLENWGPSENTYYNTGVSSFRVFANDIGDNLAVLEDNKSLAVNKPTEVSSAIESSPGVLKHPGSYAVDDRFEYYKTAWASEPVAEARNKTAGRLDNYIIVDLETPQSVRAFNVELEHDVAQEFTIETSADKVTWELVNKYSELRQTEFLINLDREIENVRYIRLRATRFRNTGYKNFGVNNLGVYAKPIPRIRLKDVPKVGEPTIVGNKLVLPKVPRGYKLEFLGSEYSQIIDDDLNIHRPLLSKEINFTYRLMNEVTGKRFTNINEVFTKKVTVDGQHNSLPANVNQKPKILNGISEWYSTSNENLELSDDVVVYLKGTQSPEINKFLENFKSEFLDITGRNLTFEIQEIPIDANGQIFIDLSQSQIPGFDNETYSMEIDNNVKIKASNRIGALWATRTLLQLLKLSDDKKLLPKGQMKDYPRYKIRGLSLDVGRKATSLETLRAYVREMSWHKFNQLQVHLSDNYIWLEDYPNDKEAYKADAFWRLESNIQNSKGEKIQSDFHYTKQEFSDFIKYAREFGVEIVPELDVPAHALAITRVFPELALTGKSTDNNRTVIDHLDIRKPEAVNKIKEIFDEYIQPGGIFNENKVKVHIGADEFTPPKDQSGAPYVNSYYKFLEEMFSHFNKQNISARLWGTISAINKHGNQMKPDVFVDERLIRNAELNIWNADQSTLPDVYNSGYKFINTLDNPLYIVPNHYPLGSRRDAYGDLLKIGDIYNDWNPNILKGHRVPLGDRQFEGAMFAIWADRLIGRATSGLSEVDVFARFKDALGVIGVKLWGNGNERRGQNFNDFQALYSKLYDAPNTDVFHKTELQEGRNKFFEFNFKGTTDSEKLFDKRGDSGFASDLNNSTLETEETESYIKLNGGNSSVSLTDKNIGLNNSLKFKIWREATSSVQNEEVIFSADAAYGDFAIKAKQRNTNKFGFSREGLDYSFNYDLPTNQWVNIELQNTYDSKNTLSGKVKLFVDGVDKGEAVGMIYRNGRPINGHGGEAANRPLRIPNSTFFFPLKKIGDNQNSFKGKITNISATPMSQKSVLTEAQKTELTRLENIPITVTPPKVNSLSEFNEQSLKLGGFSATESVKIVPNSIRVIEDKNLLILAVERSSLSEPTIKFINDLFISIQGLLITYLERVNTTLSTISRVSDFSSYTVKSQKRYEDMWNSFTRLRSLSEVSEEQFEEFTSNFQILNTILQKVSTEAQTLVRNVDTTDKNLYTAESIHEFSNFKTNSPEYNALLTKLQSDSDNFTREDYKKLETLINEQKSKLVTFKESLDNSLINASKVIDDSEIFTSESYTNYKRELDLIIRRINDDINIQLNQRNEYQKQIEKLKDSLVTYSSLVEQKIKDLQSIIKDNHTEESVKAVNDTINKLKEKLKSNTKVDLNSFNDLSSQIEEAQKKLVLKSEANNPSTSEGKTNTGTTDTTTGETDTKNTTKRVLSTPPDNSFAVIIIGSVTGIISAFSFLISWLRKQKRKNK